MLLSLSITLIIVLSITPIYQAIRHSYHPMNFQEDIYIAAKQASQYLLGSYFLDLNQGYHYLSYDNQEMTLTFDNHRLVKKEGYEILLSKIDDASFYVKNEMVYMTVQREKQNYTFLLGYARKQKDKNE